MRFLTFRVFIVELFFDSRLQWDLPLASWVSTVESGAVEKPHAKMSNSLLSESLPTSCFAQMRVAPRCAPCVFCATVFCLSCFRCIQFIVFLRIVIVDAADADVVVLVCCNGCGCRSVCCKRFRCAFPGSPRGG